MRARLVASLLLASGLSFQAVAESFDSQDEFSVAKKEEGGKKAKAKKGGTKLAGKRKAAHAKAKAKKGKKAKKRKKSAKQKGLGKSQHARKGKAKAKGKKAKKVREGSVAQGTSAAPEANTPAVVVPAEAPAGAANNVVSMAICLDAEGRTATDLAQRVDVSVIHPEADGLSAVQNGAELVFNDLPAGAKPGQKGRFEYATMSKNGPYYSVDPTAAIFDCPAGFAAYEFVGYAVTKNNACNSAVTQDNKDTAEVEGLPDYPYYVDKAKSSDAAPKSYCLKARPKDALPKDNPTAVFSEVIASLNTDAEFKASCDEGFLPVCTYPAMQLNNSTDLDYTGFLAGGSYVAGINEGIDNSGRLKGVTAKGCYLDHPVGAPARTPLNTVLSWGGQTAKSCAEAAAAAKFRYFGLQYGGECWAGNTMPADSQKFTDSSDQRSKCSMACSANSKETCGGWWSNNVYELQQ